MQRYQRVLSVNIIVPPTHGAGVLSRLATEVQSFSVKVFGILYVGRETSDIMRSRFLY
jgi:hypothetical protein